MTTNSNDRYTEQWYILLYSGSHKSANQKLGSVENLQFYAPLFFIDEQCKKMEDTWTFKNYAFIYGSQEYIYQLKKETLRNFNFMPSKSSDHIQHPFVSALAIEELRKVEKVNNGKIPFIFSTQDVVAGDKVQITAGEFAGVKATAVTKNGSKYRNIYLVITDFLIIPLGRLKRGEYEIVEFSKQKDNGNDFVLSSSERGFLIEALKRSYGISPSDEKSKKEDCKNAKIIIERYSNKDFLSLTQRVIKNSIIAIAYKVIESKEEYVHNLDFAERLLDKTESDFARLVFYICRFYCTALLEDYKRAISASNKYTGKRSLTLEKFLDFANTLKDSLFDCRQKDKSDDKTKEKTVEELWFCLSAPKKKTEAIKLFREKGIETYAPILTCNAKASKPVKKNILKDLFFVKTTMSVLAELRSQHPLFNIHRNSSQEILTYTDNEIRTFEYVNTLDIPNKELVVFSENQERIIMKFQKKSITIGDKTIEAILASSKIGEKKQKKILVPLQGVLGITVPL